MNKLHVGFEKHISLSKGSFFDDKVPPHPKAKIFRPAQAQFQSAADILRKKERKLADTLYTASPQGKNTLTVRNGQRRRRARWQDKAI